MHYMNLKTLHKRKKAIKLRQILHGGGGGGIKSLDFALSLNSLEET